MGNNQSAVDPVHVRMYSNMIQIKDPSKRIQVINTCMTSMEYVNSAKRCGIYSYLLHYLSTIQSGGQPPLLPGEAQQAQQASPALPRSVQPNFASGIGATHPSMLHAPNASTYQQPTRSYAQQHGQQLTVHQSNEPSWKVITDTPKQKAISYFASCLEVLNIQEEVALTEESLKVAYKKMALRSHPDKGGSEEYFEAVTRAYAYLAEILKFMKGGKRDTGARVDASHMSHAQQTREAEAKKWDYGGEPVRLNAKNLDMNAFNKLFEQTHMPDPDSDGYGDWLKSADSQGGGQKFKGEFNRDVFNRMFEDEARKGPKQSSALMVHPGQMALTLNPTSGVDLVGERPDSYTAAPNSRFQFTDLRGAYTSESTISDKVANVAVHDRTFEQYRASREKAPEQFNQSELHSIRDFENRQSQADEMRERKRAEMHMKNQQYHDRMKQMVITDGVDLNQKKIGY